MFQKLVENGWKSLNNVQMNELKMEPLACLKDGFEIQINKEFVK